MKKRELIKKAILAIGTIACLGLTGCDNGGSPRGQIQDNSGEDGPDPDAPVETPTVGEDPGVVAVGSDVAPETIDHTSEKALLEFAAGEWILTDEASGEDYGVFTIAEDGSCEFKLIGENDVCKGKLSFKNDFHPEAKILNRYELGFDLIPESFNVTTAIGNSSGYFHIAQSVGEDLMYLEEAGNGASYIAYEVFNNPGNDDYYDTQWLFHRENKVTDTGEYEKLQQSYAFVWGRKGDEVLLQWLDPITFEDENEYTGYKFTGAVFDESQNPGALWYPLTDGIDLTYIYHEQRFNAVYPAGIYEIYTDDYGNVAQIFETDRAAYGVYEIMPGNQDISYEGVTLTINGQSHTLEEIGNVGNRIENVEVFGDYAIVEAHLNPHRSVYTILDMRSFWPVNTIAGGTFLYDEKVWDSFYSDMNQVFDYEGELVYEVDGTEIVGLSFTDNGSKIKIEYWKDDYETVYEEEIERPECVNAPVYAYADYRRHMTAGTWADFIKYAPEDSLFMVMVNPPEDEVWDYFMPQEIGDGGSDLVYAISLQDDTGFGFGGGDSITLNKGEITAYNMTVPEGMPVYTLYAVAPGNKKATWEVYMISGKDNTCWMFGDKE